MRAIAANAENSRQPALASQAGRPYDPIMSLPAADLSLLDIARTLDLVAAEAGEIAMRWFRPGEKTSARTDYNQGGSPVNLGGWHLNAGDPGQDFWFPAFELAPGQSCWVYTNEDHPETCGFSFDYGRAIWANIGECGYLFDQNGNEVSRYCY